MDADVKKASPEQAEPVGDTLDKKMDIHSDEFWQNRFERFVSFEDDITIVPAAGTEQQVSEAVEPKAADNDFHVKAMQKLLNTKIKNPETGNMIKIASALDYAKDTQVYKDAEAKVKQMYAKTSPKVASKPKKQAASTDKSAAIKANKAKTIASIKAPENPENTIYGDALNLDDIDISNISPKTKDAIRKANMMEYYSKVIDCLITKFKQEA